MLHNLSKDGINNLIVLIDLIDCVSRQNIVFFRTDITSKTSICYFDQTNQTCGNYCSYFIDKELNQKKIVRTTVLTRPPPLSVRIII